MARKISDVAEEWAKRMAIALPPGTGITVVLSNDEGKVGVCSNVDPDAIKNAVNGWYDEVVAARRVN